MRPLWQAAVPVATSHRKPLHGSRFRARLARMDPTVPRRMWRLLEPIHALSYFAPESTEALRASGLRGYWMGYFAARSAPMGPVSASVVEATFYNFAPWLVRRAIPDAWSFASPDAVLAARADGVASALRPHADVAGPATVDRAHALLTRAVEGLCCDGRPLAMGNAGLAPPGDELAALWQLITTLREFRGDGHVAALVCARLSGLEAHLTLVASGTIPREVLQPARGFTDDEWTAAELALKERGLLGADGSLTQEGRRLRHEIEATTDEAALAPWAQLGDEGCDELAVLLRPLHEAVQASGVVPLLNPIGLPEE